MGRATLERGGKGWSGLIYRDDDGLICVLDDEVVLLPNGPIKGVVHAVDGTQDFDVNLQTGPRHDAARDELDAVMAFLGYHRIREKTTTIGMRGAYYRYTPKDGVDAPKNDKPFKEVSWVRGDIAVKAGLPPIEPPEGREAAVKCEAMGSFFYDTNFDGVIGLVDDDPEIAHEYTLTVGHAPIGWVASLPEFRGF